MWFRGSPNLTRPVVVVDRRTYRKAQQTLKARIDAELPVQARSCITAMSVWLRYEIRTGPRRHRVGYAADLEQLELIAAEVAEEMGLVRHE